MKFLRFLRLPTRADLRSILKIGPTAWGIAICLVVAALGAPFVSTYPLTILIYLLIFAALAYSMNFITGLTGYVSFGHVVFMGVGAYAWGGVVGTFHWSPLGSVVIGGTVGLLFAPGLGGVTLRFRGVYFAIASLVTALAAGNIILAPALGGGQGIVLSLGFEPLSQFYTGWLILA